MKFAGINLDMCNNSWGLIHVAAYNNDSPWMRALIKEDKTCLNTPDKNGNRPLHIAVAEKNIRVIRTLIFRGNDIDVNAVDNEGNTALHFAVLGGDSTVVELLFRHEDIIFTVQNSSGITPLDIADRYGYKEIAKYLRDKMEASARCNENTSVRLKKKNCRFFEKNADFIRLWFR